MFAVYVTHPQVVVDPAVPVPQWRLSDVGRRRAACASYSRWVRSLRRILSSEETKAIETAKILASSAGCAVELAAGLQENDRSSTGFLQPDDFEAAADHFFTHPHASFCGWERAVDAQARIVAAVAGILANHDPALPIGFIGHGGVGTLLKCALSGTPISRHHDQPDGGGNVFAFRLADRRLACDWAAMEEWDGNLR